MSYYNKYLKYKNKYLELSNKNKQSILRGGASASASGNGNEQTERDELIMMGRADAMNLYNTIVGENIPYDGKPVSGVQTDVERMADIILNYNKL